MELELDYELEDIEILSKSNWLKRVKEACKIKAFENLIDIQMEYSKGDNVGYGSLKMREYLKSKEINPSQAKLIFKIRTRMLNLKNNFKNGHKDLSCPICGKGLDSQQHMMMECLKLGDMLNLQEYNTLFGENEEKIAKVIKKVEKILNSRSTLLDDI